MKKTLEAWLRGYVLFTVNDERFWLYHRALHRRSEIMDDVSLCGWHVFKGWRMFYLRTSHLRMIDT